jgi:hypothetical protein
MKEFTQYLIGQNISIALFCALYFFALVGVAIRLLIDSLSRNKESYNTPKKYSFKFLLWDNWKRILLSILTIYLSIRFAQIIFTFNPDGNTELYLFGSGMIGLIYDHLALLLKKKTSILKVRKQ